MHWTCVDDGTGTRLPDDCVIMDKNPARLFQVLFFVMLTSVTGLACHWYSLIDLSSASVVKAVVVCFAAPVYWNVASRLEYRTLYLTRIFRGSRTVALYVFTLSILAVSSFRERLFFEAMDSSEKTTGIMQCPHASARLGAMVFALGAVLSLAGFARLGIRGTYMGEAFGFLCPALITNFPFSIVDDPMYFGSTLLHFGAAIHRCSVPGIFLALCTGLSYWTAARVFEGPFTTARYKLHNATNK